jgi:uncharacterized protein
LILVYDLMGAIAQLESPDAALIQTIHASRSSRAAVRASESRTTMVQPPQPVELLRQQRRAFWMRQLHQWHWISSALCLMGLLLFALAGIILNHARQIEVAGQVTHRHVMLSSGRYAAIDGDDERKAALPVDVVAWLDDSLQAHVAGRAAEWSADEICLPMPRPGGDGWLSIDRAGGMAEYESSAPNR